MSNNKLYDNLVQTAQSESMDFDQDRMWSSIESELDNKRRPFIFFLLFGVALSGMAFFVWQYNSSSNTGSQIIHETIPYAQAIKSTTGIPSNKISSEDYPTSITTNKNTTNNTINADVSLSLISSQKENLTTFKGKAGSKQTPLNTSKINTNNTEPSGSTTHALRITPPFNHSSDVSHLGSEESKQITPVSIPENKKSTKINLTSVNLIDHSMRLLDIPESKLSYIPLPNRKDWSRCEIKRPWGFLLEGYGGFSYPFVANGTKSTDGNSYLADWENAHTAVGGFQVGINAIVQSPGGLELSAGFEFQQLAEKLESESTITVLREVWDPMAYFILQPDGSKQWFGDTVITTVVTKEIRTTELRHRLYNIPLRVGYMTNFGDWNVGAHAGAIFHIDHVFNGFVLQPDGSYIEIDKNNQEQVYKKQIGLSYTADVHIGRQVTDQIELFLRPEFRYHHESWTSDSHALTSKIQLTQMQAGLRYRIK